MRQFDDCARRQVNPTTTGLRCWGTGFWTLSSCSRACGIGLRPTVLVRSTGTQPDALAAAHPSFLLTWSLRCAAVRRSCSSVRFVLSLTTPALARRADDFQGDARQPGGVRAACQAHRPRPAAGHAGASLFLDLRRLLQQLHRLAPPSLQSDVQHA